MNDSSSLNIKKKKIITLKRLKNWSLSLIGLVLIFMAISFTLVRVAIKSIPDYSTAIQQVVSEQIGMTLKVGVIDAKMFWLVPRLTLLDVSVFDETGKDHLLHLDELDISIDWSKSIESMSLVVGEVTLVGLDIEMGVNEKSQLHIQRYLLSNNVDEKLAGAIQTKTSVDINETIKNNFNNLNFKIIKSRIRLYDYRNEKKSKLLKNLNLHLINNGQFHVLEVKADLPEKYGHNIHFIVEIEGDLFDYKNLKGSVYLALDDFHVAPWLNDYWNKLNFTANGNISGNVWLEWEGENVNDVNSRINISELTVLYLDEKVKTWNVKKIDTVIHWKRTNEDWQLDIRDLMVDRKGIEWLKPASATLNVKNSLNQIELKADFLRIDGLVYLAGMINSAADMDIAWLNLLDHYKPTGELKNLDVFLPIDHLQDIRINTQFSQLGFSLPETEPAAVINLQGEIDYLDKTTRLTLNTKNAKIKFNTLFRNDINIKDLNGVLEISHQDHVWKLIANSLILNTPHIETKSRINFNMPDEGRAFLDLTMAYQNGEATSVARYLPAGVMGKDAVAWIDDALLKGTISNGGYLFYGYLADLPFAENQGVSLADFNVEHVDLNYLEGWPDVRNVSANLRFENDALFLNASKGYIYGSKVKNVTAYIDNFVTPTLDVKAKVNTQLEDIKTYVERSPLREDVTDYIDNLAFYGSGVLDLELFLPLYGDFETEVGGRLVLDNAGVNFNTEKYELHKVNGEIRFVGDNVESTGLTAELLGNTQNNILDIEIKTEIGGLGSAYFIGLQGEILAPLLLAPVADYKQYLEGSTKWDVAIDIASDKGKPVVNLRVLSDLQGVTSSFPGPLRKMSKAAEPIEFRLKVMTEDDINYVVNLHNGDVLDVKHSANKIQISVEAESIRGVAEVNLVKDIEIPIKIDLEYIDLNKFLGSDEKNAQKNNKSTNILPTDIPSIKVSANNLIWKKAKYSHASIELEKNKLGTVIKSFNFKSRSHIISGKGSWYMGRGGTSNTRLDINLYADNLGAFLKEYDITSNFSNGDGALGVRWEWQGAPYEFDWARIKGDGSFKFKNGTLSEINAGAGRLLGLFNFKTLFSLDFGSQMKEGFTFDEAYGSLTFGNGDIHYDDFKIESKVADIIMQGQISLSHSSIDQKVTVQPHIGSTVSIGAAVVAGPTVGGVVYLFQKIFNTDKLSEYQYTMKGNIEEPTIELISAPKADLNDDDEEDI